MSLYAASTIARPAAPGMLLRGQGAADGDEGAHGLEGKVLTTRPCRPLRRSRACTYWCKNLSSMRHEHRNDDPFTNF